jgi:hypothetical protein
MAGKNCAPKMVKGKAAPPFTKGKPAPKPKGKK